MTADGWGNLIFILLALAMLTWVIREDTKGAPKRVVWLVVAGFTLLFCAYFIFRMAWDTILANIFNWL